MSRKYELSCPVAQTLDVIGERWSALIVRDLLLGRCSRFQEFQSSLQGIAPNTLSARLKELEAAGVIATRMYSDHPPRLEYHLTEKGRSLGPVIKALRDWGSKHAPTTS